VLLLLVSIIFYAWDDLDHLLLVIFSIIINWLVGIGLSIAKKPATQVRILYIGVTLDLTILLWFKYANFFTYNLNIISSTIFNRKVSLDPIHLPVGISFYTFHGISYIVDIFRHQAEALHNPLDMGLYILMFPQLVAGPITRYHDIIDQLVDRKVNIHLFALGIERFIFGLGKKMLIANTLGQIADEAFSIPTSGLSFRIAWFGILSYTLQIYFDFSGYSDMAVGLGKMFGFELPENFDYPYISRSVREFWRRWHLSLSKWFRDYLYVPLGGNRASPLRVSCNLLVVFLLCGLWHGASWNFVFWGGFHGFLLIIERGKFGSILDKVPRLLASLYTMLMVIIGWVFFRAETFSYGLHYLRVMLTNLKPTEDWGTIDIFLNRKTYTVLIIGAVLSTPILRFLQDLESKYIPVNAEQVSTTLSNFTYRKTLFKAVLLIKAFICIFILVASMTAMATSTYNPFIYFRF